MSKVVVGHCPTCQRAIKVKPRGVRPTMSLTCKCGAKVDLDVPEETVRAAKRMLDNPQPAEVDPPKSGKVWPLLSGVGLLLFGCFLVMYGVWECTMQHTKLSWPTSRGVVQKRGTGTGVGLSSSGGVDRNQSSGSSYSVWVVVRYEVDGRSIRLKSSFSTPSAAVAQDWEARYAEGNEVTVYYDPTNPRSAVLDPGTYWLGLLMGLLGLIGIALGGWRVRGLRASV